MKKVIGVPLARMYVKEKLKLTNHLSITTAVPRNLKSRHYKARFQQLSVFSVTLDASLHSEISAPAANGDSIRIKPF